MATISAVMQLRRGTAAAWTAANPILGSGVFGYEEDTSRLKIGNGSTAWRTLPYLDTASKIYDATAAGRSLLQAADLTAVKTLLGFNNVDNTSDANKPVSTATSTAISNASLHSLGLSIAFALVLGD